MGTSELPITNRPYIRSHAIDDFFERPAQFRGKLPGKSFVQWDRSNQLFHIANVFGAAGVVQTAKELDCNQIFKAYDADALDNRRFLNYMPGIFRRDGMDPNAIQHMLATNLVPFRAGRFELIGYQLAIGSVKVQIDRRPRPAVKKDGDSAEHRSVDHIANRTGHLKNL